MRTKGLHLCNYGHEWLIQPIKVKNGEKCPKCKRKVNESKGAKLITEFLVSNSIEFIKEVPLTHFGYEFNFRLDFVVCKNHLPLFSIEYNGIQHYKNMRNKFFGGYEGSIKRKERDLEKRLFCSQVGLPVVDIPYTLTDNEIKETVLYFLQLFELVDCAEQEKTKRHKFSITSLY